MNNARRVLAEPLGLLGVVLVGTIVISALFADLIIPHDPIAINPAVRLAPPSWEYLLGTDHLGRDLFSRVVMGGRVALQVAFICISLSLGFGLALGMLAGYGPRWLDNVLILNADAADQEFLGSEAIQDCDAFVAVTQDDETNVLCSLMAKKLGTKKSITIINKEVIEKEFSSQSTTVRLTPSTLINPFSTMYLDKLFDALNVYV